MPAEDHSQTLDRYFAGERQRHLDELKDFLRIPSVSALPSHAGDVARAAEWVAGQLQAAGLPHVELVPTSRHPIVWGTWPPPSPDTPTALIYGHYDTQPADPFEEWETPPFEPTERNGRLYARGASDDKGNMLIPIKVAEAFKVVAEAPPIGLVFLFEGEEEIGSPNLRQFILAQREQLRSDVAISADGAMWSHEQPSLILSTKGSIGVQIDVRGIRSDVHSGLFGGIAPNALNAVASILGSMWTPDGKVLIDGFYDDVRELSEQEQADIDAAPFDEGAIKALLGVEALAGEPGYSPFTRNWARPTLDVNGLWGGYQGEGGKSVIPAEAHAKISCRLVADQNPDHVVAAIERHVLAHLPPGITATVSSTKGASRAYSIPPDHPALLAAGDALRAAYGVEPVKMRLGATLPFLNDFRDDLGIETVALAWEMPDEQLHGPNEFFRLESFDRGLRVYADLFTRLAALNRPLSGG